VALPAMAILNAAIGGDAPDSSAPIILYFGVPAQFAACLGWNSSWASCAKHAVGISAVGILAYWLMGLLGLSSPHAEPVTFLTLPWFSIGFLSVFAPAVVFGRLASVLSKGLGTR